MSDQKVMKLVEALCNARDNSGLDKYESLIAATAFLTATACWGAEEHSARSGKLSEDLSDVIIAFFKDIKADEVRDANGRN